MVQVVHDVYRSMNVLLYLHKWLKMWPMRDGILFACEHDAVVDLTPVVRPTLREYASETESDDSEH